MRILIVGLGLIGGSVAKTLKKNSDWFIFGYDNSSETLNEALETGTVDALWDGKTPVDCDLTVICTGPLAAVAFLKAYATLLRKGSVVTDVCGIKRQIVKKCSEICRNSGLEFIGGHPMAGKERSGFKNSDENLFNRASYILTPTADTDENALNIARRYAEMLKPAKITITDPETHDRMIAFTSQLPHVIAGAYVKSPSCTSRKGFSAGSFKDVSRVATVDENLWTELFMLNKEMLLPEIDGMISELLKYRDALLFDNEAELKEIIKQGRLIKEADLKESDERK